MTGHKPCPTPYCKVYLPFIPLCQGSKDGAAVRRVWCCTANGVVLSLSGCCVYVNFILQNTFYFYIIFLSLSCILGQNVVNIVLNYSFVGLKWKYKYTFFLYTYMHIYKLWYIYLLYTYNNSCSTPVKLTFHFCTYCII